MKLRVLGCSGGIGGRDAHTTAFLLGENTLIDCGTGVCNLELDELARIDHVFLTHSHMDHIAALPLLIDSVGEMRGMPVTVYATEDVLRILRSHVFNWLVWPDFTAIPDRHYPFLRFQPLRVGEPVHHPRHTITALPAHHTVPAVGYCIDSGEGELVYTGDTAYSAEQIAAINRLGRLRHLIIETAFSDEQHGLAMAARHLCPGMLLTVLGELTVQPQVYVSHLKPGLGQRIMSQIEAGAPAQPVSALSPGQVLEF